jgi:hypothetical protein
MTSSAGESGLILVGSPPRSCIGLAHGGEVDDAGHAGEVLHDHAGRRELDLDARLGRRVPVRERVDVICRDVGAILGAQQVLGEHLQGIGEFLGAGYRVEAEDFVGVVAHRQGAAGAEGIN